MKFLQIYFVFLFFYGIAIGNSDENDSDESTDEIINVCNKGAESSICKCEKETLKCIHAFVDGEILDITNLQITQENFLLKNVELEENAFISLRKGYILPKNVKTIIKLNFGDNHISIIEDQAFDDFDILEELDLNNNQLTSIDKKVFTKKLGSTLLRLKLYKNNIQELTSYSFKYLNKLVYLDLSQNKKLEVDSGIFSRSLSNLETLNLNWCDIEELDDETFVNLKSLKKLSLRGNPFTTIPMATVNIPSLMDLDLSSTEISDINTDAFLANNNLTTLTLSLLSKLVTINDCAFCGLSNLENLYLTSNPYLHTIHENAFGAVTKERELQNLKSLSLNRCKLTIIPEALYKWEKLKTFSISNNHFVCDCSMAWLINNPKIYAMSLVPKCDSPSALNGTHFTTLAGTFCGGKGGPTTDRTKVLWMLSFFTLLMIMLILWKNRIPILRTIYPLKIRQRGYGNFAPVHV